MQMKPEEIKRSYEKATRKEAQIGILAELNLCQKEDIRQILIKQGIPEAELPKRRGRRKNPAEPDTASIPVKHGEQVREEILTIIIEYIEKYGYPPTVREIGELAGLKSTCSVKYHLDRMIADGILETSHKSSQRAIRVPGYWFVREDLERSESKEKPEPVQYCYSWDGENYSNGLFATKEEAVLDAKAVKQMAGYDEKEVYVAQAIMPELSWNSNVEYILESMLEDLHEQCGEYADGALGITEEMEQDLEKRLSSQVRQWIARYKIKPICYKAVSPELWEV